VLSCVLCSVTPYFLNTSSSGVWPTVDLLNESWLGCGNTHSSRFSALTWTKTPLSLRVDSAFQISSKESLKVCEIAGGVGGFGAVVTSYGGEMSVGGIE